MHCLSTASFRKFSINSFCKIFYRRRLFSSIQSYVDDGSIADLEIGNIRNFSVIAHIDHGKSTLSDALLQQVGNISEKQRSKGQVLDSLKVERERGITVKAQTATMLYVDVRSNKRYLLNLIDTVTFYSHLNSYISIYSIITIFFFIWLIQ